MVICWDRTNTLTDPSSENAGALRLGVEDLLQNLKAKGYRNILLSGNNGEDDVTPAGVFSNKHFNLLSEGKKQYYQS